VLMDANFTPYSLPYYFVINSLSDNEWAQLEAASPGIFEDGILEFIHGALHATTHVYPHDSITYCTSQTLHDGSVAGWKMDYIWTKVDPSFLRANTDIAPYRDTPNDHSPLPNDQEPSNHYMLAAELL